MTNSDDRQNLLDDVYLQILSIFGLISRCFTEFAQEKADAQTRLIGFSEPGIKLQ